MYAHAKYRIRQNPPLMKQVKFILSLLLILVCSTAKAVIAYPGTVEYKQPDGIIIQVTLHGDERVHWYESEDGYTLLPNQEGFLTLAVRDVRGRLVPSQYKMMPVSARPTTLVDAMKRVQKHEFFSQEQFEQKRQMTPFPEMKALPASRRNAPAVRAQRRVVGQFNYLVLLIQFPDLKFTRTQKEYDNLMNQTGYTMGGNYGSVRDFYSDCSDGQLTLKSTVAGVYTAENGYAEYDEDAQNGWGTVYLAAEALENAYASGINLADFDSDGDGFLDGLHIIFAGYGEEAGASGNHIWSHELSVPEGYYMFEVGGYYVNKYSCTPELAGNSGTTMSKIGVICHEIGHALGTPDFYDTDYESYGQYGGTGTWDVMASGSWNNGGACPPHFNPYTKCYDFGWAEPVVLNDVTGSYSLSSEGNHFCRLNTQTPGEFFLMEHRSASGFNAYVPGSGLMVYRSSENMSRASDDRLNAEHRQQFYPLCANSTYALPNSTPESYGTVNSSSAPFPGSSNKTELTNQTKPSLQDWAGNNTSRILKNIRRSGTMVTFDVLKEGGVPVGSLGDANDDGLVDISDVSSIAGYILSGKSIDVKAGDVNGDGLINVSDITWLTYYLLNGKYPKAK